MCSRMSTGSLVEFSCFWLIFVVVCWFSCILVFFHGVQKDDGWRWSRNWALVTCSAKSGCFLQRSVQAIHGGPWRWPYAAQRSITLQLCKCMVMIMLAVVVIMVMMMIVTLMTMHMQKHMLHMGALTRDFAPESSCGRQKETLCDVFLFLLWITKAIMPISHFSHLRSWTEESKQ